MPCTAIVPTRIATFPTGAARPPTVRRTLPPNLALALALLAGPAVAQHDPTATDGDKYRVVLENARVRVLAYDDRPGEKTHLHRHPSFVVVALGPFERRIALEDGRTMKRAFAAGDVLFSNGEAHIGENVGTTPTRVIMIELKGLQDGATGPTAVTR
jgi:hypothetical protein